MDTVVMSVRTGSAVSIQRIIDIENFEMSVRDATLTEECNPIPQCLLGSHGEQHSFMYFNK